MSLPFDEIERSNTHCVRIFQGNLSAEILQWHWDEQDRLITPLDNFNWLVQLDNELPQPFDKPVFIKQGQWHRLISASHPLAVKIEFV